MQRDDLFYLVPWIEVERLWEGLIKCWANKFHFGGINPAKQNGKL
jgi:hypothetical protein